MRVLIINSVCGRQSTGRIVSDIQKRLLKEGHECVIAYGEKKSLLTEGNYHIGEEYDRYFHAIQSRMFDSHGLHSKGSTKKLTEYIRLYNPDIINLHNIHGYYLNYKILFEFLKAYKKPVVWTLHDCWAFTGHAAYCEWSMCDKWKNGCGRCAQKRAYPQSFTDFSKRNWELKKNLFTNISNMGIITPSEWLKNLVESSFLREYPVQVIHNGVNTKVFKKVSGNLREKKLINKNDKIYLGVAAIWGNRKGLFDFVKMAGMLKTNEKIVLIGIDNKQKKTLPSNIISVNKTDSIEELAEWYSLADVFINPTYEDNYPTVNIEALACGTPVVTYCVGGSPECINLKNGYVAEKGNISMLLEMARKASDINDVKNNTNVILDMDVTIKLYIDFYEKFLYKK